MKNISVIGAGTMGNGIAHVFAMNGYSVNVVDVNQNALDAAKETIASNLQRMVKKEKISNDLKESTLHRLEWHSSMQGAVEKADLVVEAATENVDLKLSIFKELDKLAGPQTLLASNTSSISITKIAAVTIRQDRVLGMHFMNPVPVMKLVEVIRGYGTSDQVVEGIVSLSKDIGKVPVLANDYPGFVANRILMPMINEAIYALHEGVAGVEEIDTIMKLGMAHPMGPLQLADFIGLDVCLSILEVLYEGFKLDKYAPCPLLVNMVQANKLGRKSKEGFYTYTHGSKDSEVSSYFT
ncbi:MAG: 3-hydroxybutyryl-CoA dehydrogenase [Bacteroidetes bacterium]|jgi:3-hydroxybutyryl-CoA dehydrogenase|nr:3-hydroxybutyryl-CoA dehydrogenase [Bacteroidota bacterium]